MDAEAAWRARYGPTALVTGASEGIGEAFARALGARGLDLILVARRRDRLETIAQEIREQSGVGVRVHPDDLSEPAGVDTLVRSIDQDQIGLLVSAAGFGAAGPFLKANPATELAMLDVNCRATLGLTLALAPAMAARGRGGLVLLSSLVAFQGSRHIANYAATKAYVQTLAEGLHSEFSEAGVDVLSVAPGPVATGFAKRADLRYGAEDRPEAVARQSLAALGRARTVRPGRLSKVLGWSLSTLPRRARTKVMSRIMGAMTKHQHASR
ncbi:MAG: SDR family NAD(P)-dependent oxidoreductase [Pseudomonadota bacterium]